MEKLYMDLLKLKGRKDNFISKLNYLEIKTINDLYLYRNFTGYSENISMKKILRDFLKIKDTKKYFSNRPKIWKLDRLEYEYDREKPFIRNNIELINSILSILDTMIDDSKDGIIPNKEITNFIKEIYNKIK